MTNRKFFNCFVISANISLLLFLRLFFSYTKIESRGGKVKKFFYSLVLLYLIVFNACHIFNDLHYDEDNSHSSLKFKYNYSTRSIDGVIANEIFYVNVLTAEYSYTTLLDGDNSIELDKSGVYIFAFVNNPEQEGFPIEVVGSISILQTDGYSIPVSEDADSEIELGSLIINNGEFESSISSSDFEIGTGYDYELLSRYAKFDSVYSKFINPDINKNGEYDFEEKFDWKFSSLNDVHFNPSDIDTSELKYNNPSDYFINNMTDRSFVFGFNDYYDLEAADTVVLYKPDGTTLEASNAGIEENGIRQYYFTDHDNFVEGDYVIDINGVTLYINSVKLFDSSITNLEGFTFPVIRVEDDGVNVTKFIWKWYQIVEGDIIPSTRDENLLKMSSFYFYGNKNSPSDPYFVVNPIDFDIDPFEDGELILPPEAVIPIQSDNYICDYWDYANNDFKFLFLR